MFISTRKRKEAPARSDILDALKRFPGAHMRQLARITNQPLGTVEYHLRKMVREGQVLLKKDGSLSRYYPIAGLGSSERAIAACLHSPPRRRIVALLVANGPMDFAGMIPGVGVSPSTLSFHLSKMEEAGVVVKRPDGRSKIVCLADPETASRMMKMIVPSLLDEIASELEDAVDML